jgi:hypothetical protein
LRQSRIVTSLPLEAVTKVASLSTQVRICPATGIASSSYHSHGVYDTEHNT